MRLFDRHVIPKGKEARHLAIAALFLSFWSYVALLNLFDGAIKFRGAMETTTFAESPFWVGAFAVVVVVVEFLAFRYLVSAILAFYHQRRQF